VTDRTTLTPLAPTTQVTFPVAGTFHYFCEIHGTAMAGDIVVQ